MLVRLMVGMLIDLYRCRLQAGLLRPCTCHGAETYSYKCIYVTIHIRRGIDDRYLPRR